MERINPRSSIGAASGVKPKSKKLQAQEVASVIDSAQRESDNRDWAEFQNMVGTAFLYSYDFARALEQSPLLYAHQKGSDFLDNLYNVPASIQEQYGSRQVPLNQAVASSLGKKALHYIDDCLESWHMSTFYKNKITALKNEIKSLNEVSKKSDDCVVKIQNSSGELLKKPEAEMNEIYSDFLRAYSATDSMSPSDALQFHEKATHLTCSDSEWHNEMRVNPEMELKRNDLLLKCRVLVGKNQRMQLGLADDLPLSEKEKAKKEAFTQEYSISADTFHRNPSRANWVRLQEVLRQGLISAVDDELRGICALSLQPTSSIWRKRYEAMLQNQKTLDEAEAKAQSVAAELLAAEELELRPKTRSRKGKEKIPLSSPKNAKSQVKLAPVESLPAEHISIPELHPSSSSESALEKNIAEALSSRKKGKQFEGEIAKFFVEDVSWSSFDMNVFDLKNKKTIAEYDFEFPFVRVEVTLRPDGKKAQIEKRLLSLNTVNADRRATILYAPNYTADGILEIANMIKQAKKKGTKVSPFFFANKLDDLHDLLYAIHRATNVQVKIDKPL